MPPRSAAPMTTASNGEYASQFSLHSATDDSARKLSTESTLAPAPYEAAEALLSLLALASEAHWLPDGPEISTASIATFQGGALPKFTRTAFTGSLVAGNEK